MKNLPWMLLSFFPVNVWAQSPTPMASASPAAVVAAIDKAAGIIPDSIPMMWMAIIAFVISEIVMRVFPTAKPKSWALLGAGIFGSLEKLFGKLKKLLESIGSNLQNIK